MMVVAKVIPSECGVVWRGMVWCVRVSAAMQMRRISIISLIRERRWLRTVTLTPPSSVSYLVAVVVLHLSVSESTL